MFDAHCHLNFKVFKNNLDEVIDQARTAGVNYMIVPGTDIETSKRAVEIAEKHKGVYAAVGIHPHHVYQIQTQNSKVKTQNYNFRLRQNYGGQAKLKSLIQELKKLILFPKVVAMGEIGLDKHQYSNTKYQNYQVDSEFVELQKELLIAQIKLAVKYKKTIILHNRETTEELIKILLKIENWKLKINMVFHCCEPDDRLLQFAIKNHIYIGVDGDVTYRKDKQEFVKKIPLELMVLETDSPYLLPEPLKTKKLYPNEPKNLRLIAEFIAKIKNVSINRLTNTTEENTKRLFHL